MIQADHVVPLICLWRESRSNPEAYEALIWVMLNRRNDLKKRWPRTMTGITLQPAQYSSFNEGDANSLLFPNPTQATGWTAFMGACDSWERIMESEGGVPVDPTKGANHYHDHSIQPPAVAWLGKGKVIADLVKYRTVTIGPFDFYKL